MLKLFFKRFYIILFTIFIYSSVQAQEERRVSLSLFGGVAFFGSDNFNNAGLSTKVLNGYKPSPLVGLGVQYKLTKRLYLGEYYSILLGAKSDNRTLNSHTFRTQLKYYLLNGKKFNPYVTAGININLVKIKRKESEELFIPDAGNSTNAIGSGFQLDSIQYRNRALTLSGLPMLGASIGAGFDIRLNKRFNFFTEYNYHLNGGKKNDLLEQYYFANNSSLAFHTISAGITMKLFKPQKQLLATLNRDQWRNSKPIDVKGTIIYKKPPKTYNKVLTVEKTDTAQVMLEQHPTDERAVVFFSKGIELGDYKFMLPKKKRKILRADIQIMNYNHIDIEDDELELEMVENDGSENILSRDANFAVLLREGFQHEVELTTTAENIMGKLAYKNPNCRIRIVLKDQYDSVIAIIDSLDDGTFNFVDVKPGDYKLNFQKGVGNCSPTAFQYSFTGSTPFVQSQSNVNEPEDTIPNYSLAGIITSGATKKEAPKGTVVKLIDPTGRVESSTALGGAKSSFKYNDLSSPDYDAVYTDPSEKAGMNYTIKDKKQNILKNVVRGATKKAVKADLSVKGKVEFANPAMAKTTSVLLIDSMGKVKQTLPLQPDGSFSFDNLAKNKYRVAYESTDPLAKGKLKYGTIDKSLKITKTILPDLLSQLEEVDTIHVSGKTMFVKDTVNTPIVIGNKKTTNNTKSVIESVKNTSAVEQTSAVKKPIKTGKEEPVRYSFTEFKPGTTYNEMGYEVKPEGYGVQISSFFINSNLEKFCQRVKAKGEKNIYIQVIPKDKNNPSAGLIYRVVLGADKDKEKVNKKVPNYMDKGYDAVLRKHLEIVTP